MQNRASTGFSTPQFGHAGTARSLRGSRGPKVAQQDARALRRDDVALLLVEGERLLHGTRRVVDLASIVLAEPRLLLLDEPTAGINPTLINGLMNRVQRVNRELGITLLVIEHNMRVIMNLASHIYCMSRGELLASGSPSQIRDDQRVIDAYLGAH